MVWQRICMTMLAGAMASMLALPLRGEDQPKDSKEPVPAPKDGGTAPATGGADCCGQQYRTVTCYEWVPETHMVKKTCYRHECRQVTCCVNKVELVPETRTCCVTCSKLVPEYHQVTCCENVCVPYTEQRTCMERRVVCKDVCTTVRRVVDHGHWECCQEPTLMGRLGWGRRHDCCGCNSCCNSCCTPTRTVRHWVSCPTCEECPCHHTVRCVECVPVTKCVTCYRHETRQVCKSVCCYHRVCEQKQVTYTAHVARCVPCQETHTVSVCVPYCVEVPVCCYVKKCVTKQVPCCNDCCNTCNSCNTCGNSCCGGWHRRLFSNLHLGGCGCGHECGGCHSGCGCN